MIHCVRLVRPDEIDLILPACIAMFTEEVGVSPLVNDGGVLYRSRVEELVRQGRSFARIEDGVVVFKAEVGAVSSRVCQVQGVWVHPQHRGTGLAIPGMAAVAKLARESVAPVVSLYVNSYNEPAMRTYQRVGFQPDRSLRHRAVLTITDPGSSDLGVIVLLRMSSLFLRTLREDPADAEVPSHRLLVRAGYIRRAAPGIYSWLPLGYAVFRNVERIVREEMDAAGFQEVHFPALLPREPYEVSGRWTEYGDLLFRLQDRKGGDYLLGPTHEEMFTLLVKDLYSSYKDLPLSIYQIQTKYRDEARPRAGLLRGREFVMKDSYSFDIDDEGLQASYDKHRAAYIQTFDRLGLPYVIVAAVSGRDGRLGVRRVSRAVRCRRGHLRPLYDV